MMVEQSAERQQTWGIVGGGILGLTLAYRLARAGQPVTLFESSEQVGGLASAWQLGDVFWDRYYHVTLQSDSNLRSLLQELGLEHELEWVETRSGFYMDGTFYSMSNIFEFLKFPLSVADKLRLGLTIFYASRIKDWKRLERIPVQVWLKRWSGEHTFRKIWLPLLRAKLGETYEHTSAAFIWATIARLYAARRTGLKKEVFGYVPGGYSCILERFAERLLSEGVQIRLSSPVKQVFAEESGLKVEPRTGKSELFDNVIVTVPPPVAAKVCPQLTEEEKGQLESLQYLGVVCASLLLRRPLTPFYITNITESWVPFTAVIEMSALVDRYCFKGRSLVYLPKYVSPEDPIHKESDKDIEQLFWGGLAKMHPDLTAKDLLCSRVARARYVFALPTINYSEKLPSMLTSIPGLYVVNSAHIVNGTLNVNETVQLANSAACLLMKESGALFRKRCSVVDRGQHSG